MTTRPDSQTVRAFFERKERERRASVQARAERLRASVRHLARLLRDEFGARRVWLFGSLAWGEPHERSDIDLAVEGLSSAEYFRAVGRLLQEAPASVDLVRMEEAAPALAERIFREGERVDV